MLPFIIGGVTLAVAGYALCEDGCDYFSSGNKKRIRYDEDEPNSTVDNEQKFKNSDMAKKAKKFHKFKKFIYTTSMQEYSEFLEKYQLDNTEFPNDVKLKKELFREDQITDELKEFISKISNALDVLSHNLNLAIRVQQTKTSPEEETLVKIKSYASNIFALSHVKLFDSSENINKLNILSALVEAMKFTTQKDSMHVDLTLDSNA